MAQACKNCHLIFEKSRTCPNCGESILADDYSGELFVVNASESEIAKKMKITKPGRYAVKVR